MYVRVRARVARPCLLCHCDFLRVCRPAKGGGRGGGSRYQQEAIKQSQLQTYWAGEGVEARRAKLRYHMYRDAAVRWQTQLADSLFVGVCVMLVTCVACALRYSLLGRRLNSCPRWDSLPAPSFFSPWPMVYVRPPSSALSPLLGQWSCSPPACKHVLAGFGSCEW